MRLLPGFFFAAWSLAWPAAAQVVSLPAQRTTFQEYVAEVIAKSGRIGGIESVRSDCAQSEKYAFPEFQGTAEQAIIQAIHKSDPKANASFDTNAIVVRANSTNQTLLDTIVEAFEFSTNDPISKSTGALFDRPEVARRLRDLGLTGMTSEIGFGRMSRDDGRETVIRLSRVTVLEALNRIGAQHHAVWLYEQWTCDGRTMFRVNWPRVIKP
jgi:hypothetical protein